MLLCASVRRGFIFVVHPGIRGVETFSAPDVLPVPRYPYASSAEMCDSWSRTLPLHDTSKRHAGIWHGTLFHNVGLRFPESFRRVPADLVVSFYRFFDWVSSLVSGRQGGECLVFRVFILQRLSIIHICQTVLPGFKKIINMPFFFIFVRGVVKSECEIIHKDTNYSE